MTDKNFDFMEVEEIPEVESEIATGGNPKEKKVETEILFRKFVKEDEVLEPPGLTPEIIKEARKLAGSKKGLEIEPFFKKYNIQSINIDRLLHGKLDKDGYLL